MNSENHCSGTCCADPVEQSAAEVFEQVMVWPRRTSPIPLDELVDGMEWCDRQFVSGAYRIAARLYEGVPPRKNHELAFTHPTNVAMYLKLAQCQPHVIASGLLHDVLEDRVDLQKALTGHRSLELELELRREFASEIIDLSTECAFPRDVAERVVEIVWTLTRHKIELYYKSISAVFNHTDISVRIAAALVKLSDRMHNIQTLDNYENEEKLYQCFKNIFILNNAKQLLAEVNARNWDPRMTYSLDKIFKKSGKAVFQALLTLTHTAHSDQKVFQIVSYLALALRKFMLERQGLWRVTNEIVRPGAPVYALFDGIVMKYDHRLHHEEPDFFAHVEKELEYMRETFEPLGLSDAELRTAISYKDAMALLEVVASLLYSDDYMIRGFECSQLCRRGRNCMKRDRLGLDQAGVPGTVGGVTT